ncbi:penicillin-binding transpeptidase domain-containing protein [Fibrobacter sp.]|uniref:penicillin-binding transpeptidase domain-containing protein n=1 Tax=Fibrobacter sp. TaxID=35828 RepID=UPI00386D6ADD
MDYNNYLPKKRLPYAVRIRNRIIVFAVFMGICALMGTCIFGEKQEQANPADEEEIVEETAENTTEQNTDEQASATVIREDGLFPKADSEDLVNTQTTVAAAVVPETPAEADVIDSTHIKAQKDVFLAEKIDNLLRRFRPEYAVILMVEPRSNEIIAWGERRNNHVQEKPDYFIKNTFPAASLAKTITISAAMESNRYSLTSQIPMIGSSTKLYKSQLRVKEGYKGPFIELQDAYARSANPPMAIVGMNVGADRLRSAAKKLGYNTNFPGALPPRSNYAPPDTGYGLAEVSSGFTDATTLTPLLAAAQVRAILMKKPLEIPWAANLDGYAPKSRIALDVGKFSDNTYYGLREAMIRTVTHGTARKNISTRHMARKNYEALNIGGKTGSLDGKDPYGRYEWFMGFAQSKEDPSKAVVLVIMQVHDLQGMRSQPATQVAGMLFNYWAHQNLPKKGK